MIFYIGILSLARNTTTSFSNSSHGKIIKDINKGAQRLNEIIENMLDVAKIDNQELHLYFQEMPLYPVFHEISIQDTGIGINPANQELIFTKFYQTAEVNLHSTGKTKFDMVRKMNFYLYKLLCIYSQPFVSSQNFGVAKSRE